MFKYRPMLPYKHVYDAGYLPALLTGSAELFSLKICDLYLFTIITKIFPLPLHVKGQNRALFNRRKDDSLHASGFDFCVDRQTA